MELLRRKQPLLSEPLLLYRVPTVLAVDGSSSFTAVVRKLCESGYHVLEAHDQTIAVDFARMHSRQIHILLIDSSENGHALASLLKRYRPTMHVLFLPSESSAGIPPLGPENVLAAIQQFVAEEKI